MNASVIIKTATACLLGWSIAGSVAAEVRKLPEGAPVAAPTGLLELCMRAPTACIDPTAAVDDAVLEEIRARASEKFWATTFAGPSAPASLTPASGYDWSRVFTTPVQSAPVVAVAAVASAVDVAAVAPAVEPVAEPAVEPVVAPAEAPVEAASEVLDTEVKLDRAMWRRVNQVNRSVNRRIKFRSDAALYGQADRWAVGNDVVEGDCEDYVLAKRRELIALGIPAESLSMALVKTPRGEDHAVLLISTPDGEMVLDNLSPWISRWDRRNYQWLQRQVGGRPFEWRAIAG